MTCWPSPLVGDRNVQRHERYRREGWEEVGRVGIDLMDVRIDARDESAVGRGRHIELMEPVI